MKRHATADGVFMTFWMMANVFSLAAGWYWLETTVVSNVITGIVALLIFLFLVFGGQWLVLRSYLMIDHWWLVMSVTACLVVFMILASVSLGTGYNIGMTGRYTILDIHSTIAFGVIGAIFGAMQMYVLCRYIPSGIWWCGVSSVGWAGAYAIADVLPKYVFFPSSVGDWIMGATFGFVYSLITGAILIYWRHQKPYSVYTMQVESV
ncbi:MAG: hypothetical protein AAGF95_35075 [Chloroflexota bacterium]